MLKEVMTCDGCGKDQEGKGRVYVEVVGVKRVGRGRGMRRRRGAFAYADLCTACHRKAAASFPWLAFAAARRRRVRSVVGPAPKDGAA